MERRSAAAVFGLWTLVREVRRAPADGLVEQEADIAQQGRLVALDSEQVVRAAVEQIAGQRGRVSRAPSPIPAIISKTGSE